MTNPRLIRSYQQKCFSEYASDIGLPAHYCYPDGNPIRPLPPVKVAMGGLMVVGAYPSARFESRRSSTNLGRRRLVPVADNLQPFGDEQYFDGIRIRNLESSVGLMRYLLAPLGLHPNDCWITDLVKVFLYKKDHEASCAEAAPDFEVPVFRGEFKKLGEKSLPWLQKEIELCKPSLVVTLSYEVAQVVSGEGDVSADDLLTREITNPVALLGYPGLFLPHPDACRRSEKWRGVMTERIGIVASSLE